jgi:chromate transporter
LEKVLIFTLLELFWLFAKISVFSFGGGYVLIGFLQHELVSKNWLSVIDFVNIVSISQMTPGPIAINAATFVGYKVAGASGAVISTIAVVLLPFILVILISIFYNKYQSNPFVQNALMGIRPVCAALIIISWIKFYGDISIQRKNNRIFRWRLQLRFKITFTVCAVLILAARFKINSIWLFLRSMIVGIFLF